MRIRELKLEDFKENQELILELLIDTYMINFHLSREQCQLLCREKLGMMDGYIEKSAIVIGAFKDDTLIGFLWLYKHDFFGEIRLHVNQIAVCSQFRGKGIGRQLMDEAEKQAKRLGVDTIDLFVSETNAGAVKMYNKLDFETERRYMKKRVRAEKK